MRKKRSPIWLLPPEQFKKLVAQSESYTAILSFFGRKNKGGNARTLKDRIQREMIDVSHIEASKKGRMFGNHRRKKMLLKEILVKGSTYHRSHLKARLIKEGVLANECSVCKQKTEWRGLPLIMVLDHINGDSTDNRIRNLRLLCPNCNSQTDTFCRTLTSSSGSSNLPRAV